MSVMSATIFCGINFILLTLMSSALAQGETIPINSKDDCKEYTAPSAASAITFEWTGVQIPSNCYINLGRPETNKVTCIEIEVANITKCGTQLDFYDGNATVSNNPKVSIKCNEPPPQVQWCCNADLVTMKLSSPNAPENSLTFKVYSGDFPDDCSGSSTTLGKLLVVGICAFISLKLGIWGI